MNPIVTVLLCTKNRSEWLVRCLRSLQELDFDRFDVLVVDNGSSQFEVPALTTRFPIRYFRQPVAGISYARNSVLPYCSGEFIALIDDDAVAHPNWLKAALKSFSHPEVGCVTGRILPPEIESEWQQRYFREKWLPSGEDAKLFTMATFDPFETPAGAGTNIVARKSILQQCGFPEFFGAGTAVGAEDDHYLFFQILKLGWKLYYDPECIVYHPYPKSEEQYYYLVRRSFSSRGAYILWFLISEPGYRFRTLRHILSKVAKPKSRRLEMGLTPRTGGFVTGGIALARSWYRIRKQHRIALSSITEIKIPEVS
jgi:glycosyltransferase involved in cell wall biosynthesis